MSVLALDVGTSSVRAQRFDERAESAGEMRQEEYDSDDPVEVAAAVRMVQQSEQGGPLLRLQRPRTQRSASIPAWSHVRARSTFGPLGASRTVSSWSSVIT